MFERYTERARRTLFFARYEATANCAAWTIEPEHLLLGLLRDGKGLTATILARAHLSPTDVQRETEKRASGAKVSTQIEIPFSAPLKRVLQQAAAEADGLGHHYIGTEHLLLALLAQRDAAEAAERIEGLTLDQARQDVVQFHKETTLERGDPADTSDEYREVRARIPPEARGGATSYPHQHKPDIPPSYAVHIVPTIRPAGTSSTTGPTYWAVAGFTLRAALARLYAIGEACIELPPAIDAQARFDIAVVLPNIESPVAIGRLVQQGIERHLGFTLTLEPRAMDVYVLTADPSRTGAAEHSRLGAFGVVDLPVGGVAADERATIEQFTEVMKASATYRRRCVRRGRGAVRPQSSGPSRADAATTSRPVRHRGDARPARGADVDCHRFVVRRRSHACPRRRSAPGDGVAAASPRPHRARSARSRPVRRRPADRWPRRYR